MTAAAPSRGTFVRGMRILARGAGEERRLFAWAVAGSVVYGAGTAGSGWLVGRITERVIVPALTAAPGEQRVTTSQVWLAGAFLLAVALVTVAGVLLRRIAAGATMYALQARYRRALARRYLDLPLAWHHSHPAGRLLATAASDVEATWQAMAVLPFALGVVVLIAVAGVAMVAADPVLGGVGLLVVPALVVANAAYSRRMSPRVRRVQQLRGQVSATAHESFEGALVVKTLGLAQGEVRRFALDADRLRDANVAAGRTRGSFDPAIEALPQLGTLVVLAVGAARTASGAADVGDVVQVAYMLSLLAFPVRAIGWTLAELPRTVAGDARLQAVLSEGATTPWGPRGAGRLGGAARPEVRGVGYHHPTPVPDPDDAAALLGGGLLGGGLPAGRPPRTPRPVLRGVDLDVAAGTTTAVVGGTGSGKSTLAGLLVRLVDPTSGQVLLDGVDVRELAEGELAGVAALVPQSTFVFDDTVRGNVALGLDADDVPAARRTSDEDVWAALRLAQADGFVAALPEGLDTRVGERGTTLSGGQRQRLALARALVRRPRLLVLDDATSALDPAVERAVLDGLAATRSAETGGHGTTVVVVASRPATIALADEVVHLEHGRVVDRGTADELAERDPGYRELVTAYARAARERAAALPGWSATEGAP